MLKIFLFKYILRTMSRQIPEFSLRILNLISQGCVVSELEGTANLISSNPPNVRVNARFKMVSP